MFNSAFTLPDTLHGYLPDRSLRDDPLRHSYPAFFHGRRA